MVAGEEDGIGISLAFGVRYSSCIPLWTDVMLVLVVVGGGCGSLVGFGICCRFLVAVRHRALLWLATFDFDAPPDSKMSRAARR